MKKTLKSIMSPGKKILGTILQLPSEELAEILGYAGLDIIVLDMEHCPTTPGKLVSLIRACEAADVLPFVRVPDVTDEDSIKKALDARGGRHSCAERGQCGASQKSGGVREICPYRQ